MTRSHKGMRKGISLIEMLVAVVMFGIIGTISYTYYKNYYDTSLAAKQLRIYTIVDQAAQLSNAFDLYNTKVGTDPVTVQEIVDQRILTEAPVKQPFLSSTGWTLEENLTIVGADTTGVAFRYKLDGVGSNTDNLDYCNILNQTGNTAWSLDYVESDQNTTAQQWSDGNASATSEFEYFHCADNNGTAGSYDFDMIFIKRATVQ
ncbi:MAG: type II secretion system GspH family protein [Sulfurimonas sp.]|nr:type II secretion system GspH family protein [Sulfurimonas sp.]